MERAYESSKKLYDALEGVEKEWTNNSPAQVVQYMESLQEKMACPNLSTLLDNYNNDQDYDKNNKNNHAVVQVSVKAHVRDVAKLMKEHKTTAVLVMDHGGLAGIFTTKDIVLRVIAAGLAPDNCSVIRVMTPHPDTATTSTSILEALKKMHDGHYLNLPILDDDRNICGLIDVLRLTYATLEQISSIEGNTTNDNSALTINNNSFINDNNNTISSNQQLNNSESKFWDNITGSSDLHDSESVVSDSSRMFDSLSTTPQPDDHRETTTTPTTTSTTTQSFSSTVGFNPNSHSFYHGVTLSEDDDQRSILSLHTFLFKFSDGARTYRFRCHFSLSALRRAIKIRIQTKTNKPSTIPKIPKGEEEHDGMDLTLAYLDDENDQVLLTCDTDIIEAVELAQKMGYDRVKLIVHSNDDPVLSQPPSAENNFLSINTISEQHESHYLMEQHDQQNQNQQCPSFPIHNTFPTSSTTTKLPNNTVPTDFNNCLATTSEEEVSSVTPTTTSSSSNNSTSDSDESAAEQRYNYYQHRRSSHSELSDDNNRRKYHQNQHYDVDVTNDVDDMLIPAAITFLGAVIVGVFTLGR